MNAHAATWVNAILFQVVWFATVVGAAHALGWLGPLAVVAFAAYQLQTSRRRADLTLIALALLIGLVADSLLAQTRLVVYASPWPSSEFAPAWILALWVNFALTLNHSLSFLRRNLLLAAFLGALGAPLSYFFAAHTWHAITLAEPPTCSLLAIAAIWCLVTPLLVRVARTLDDRIPTSSRMEASR